MRRPAPLLPPLLPVLLPVLLAVLLPVLGGPWAPSPVSAEDIYSKEANFTVPLPVGWTREAQKPAWDKDGIKAGGRRVLEKLDDGKPAQGQGAQLHVSVVPAPEGKSLADLAADPLQREFLMRYFGKEPAWPPVKVDETKVKGEVGEAPALVLRTEGTSLNLAGNEGRCIGVLLLCVAKKQLTRVRLLAWTTPKDDEGLRYEMDSIELEFMLIDAQGDKPKPERPKDPDGAGGDPADEKLEGDAAEEKVVVQSIQGWRVKKPKKLHTSELDKAKYQYTEAMFEANDTHGSCQVMISVYPNGLVIDGRQAPDQDIRKWMTLSWWQSLTAEMPEGRLETFPWARTKPNGTFLTLPDLEKPEVVFETPKKRPLDMDAGDMFKKWKFVEEAKGMLGKQKVSEGYRGVVRGNVPRVGPNIVLRYSFRTPKFTFMINVSIARDGAKRYAEPVRELLESLEFTK